MLKGFYVLDDDNKPVEASDIKKWAQFFESEKRVIAQDQVRDARISTVFLGLDHNFMNEGPPILFETMIFGGRLDGEQYRYSTYDEAINGHKTAIGMVLLHGFDMPENPVSNID